MQRNRAKPGSEYFLEGHMEDCNLQPNEDGSYVVPSWCTCNKYLPIVKPTTPEGDVAVFVAAVLFIAFIVGLIFG